MKSDKMNESINHLNIFESPANGIVISKYIDFYYPFFN